MATWYVRMEANLRFHHKGKFGKSRYVGGEESIVKGVDLDMFSYTVLMEFVKEEPEYTEIRGIYAWKGPTSGWKLVADDVELLFMMQIKNNGDYIDFYVDTVVEDSTEPIKQMQPHVIVRPRKNMFSAAKSQKRQFVTAHHLQQVAKKKQQTDQVFTPRKSTWLNNSQVISEAAVSPPINKTAASPHMNRKKMVSKKSIRVSSSMKLPDQKENPTEANDATMNINLADVRSKLDFNNSPHDKEENTDENEFLNDDISPPPPPPLTEYERERDKNVS